MPPPKSDLPIITPPDPFDRKTPVEKYGSFFYLGILGLVVLVGLITWFSLGMWSLRDVWSNVYILHDKSRPKIERINAAFRLSRDDQVTQQEYWDIGLRKSLPDLARYLMWESLGTELVVENPRAYLLAIARSEDWPDWLRLLALRPLAYVPEATIHPSAELLDELSKRPDPIFQLWTDAIQAIHAPVEGPQRDEARATLRRVAEEDGPNQKLARLLLKAVDAPESRRRDLLDQATLWLRHHHPDAARIWRGWHVQDDQLRPASAPDLHRLPSRSNGERTLEPSSLPADRT